MIKHFCDWLAATPLSQVIQNVGWVIPTVQSIHILAIAVVASAVVALDARLLGLSGAPRPLTDVGRRFLPWFWGGLLVLLVSGVALVIGEPARELLNPAFLTKIVLVIAIAALTATVQVRVRGDALSFERSASARVLARALGATSLLLLLAIITCGRWIAYVLVGG